MYQMSENEYKQYTVKKRRALILMLLAICCALAMVFMVMRVFNWQGKEQDAELLAIVNPWNSAETVDFKPKLTKTDYGFSIDKRCVNPLEELLDACTDAGYSPVVLTAYSETSSLESCEHVLGLSVDIVDMQYSVMDISQAESLTQKWLMENSWQYGFVLRYPEGKEVFTGMSFKPWHYRYVGKEAAEQMYQLELCLEEYVAWFYSEDAIVEY